MGLELKPSKTRLAHTLIEPIWHLLVSWSTVTTKALSSSHALL
jgi:hypothetical protein